MSDVGYSLSSSNSLTSNAMHKPYTTRACAAPAVRVSPRLGGDAEVAGGATSVVVVRGGADLRRAVADVIVVERVALEWECMIDGEKQIQYRVILVVIHSRNVTAKPQSNSNRYSLRLAVQFAHTILHPKQIHHNLLPANLSNKTWNKNSYLQTYKWPILANPV